MFCFCKSIYYYIIYKENLNLLKESYIFLIFHLILKFDFINAPLK